MLANFRGQVARIIDGASRAPMIRIPVLES
jgi:hypothetical protein